MQKLFLAETQHQFILTITADDNITNTGQNCMTCVEFVRPALNQGIISNADACMYKCSSVPKQKRTIIQNWQLSEDVFYMMMQIFRGEL